MDEEVHSPVTARRLSHHPPTMSTSQGHLAACGEGPPSLEHLPNYCTLSATSLNTSSNNSAPSVPLPLLALPGSTSAVLLDGPSSCQAPQHVASSIIGGPLVAIPPQLQLIPMTTPTLLKLEPPNSPSVSSTTTTLWSNSKSIALQNCVGVEDVPNQSSSVASTSTTWSLSPTPLTHPQPLLSTDDVPVTASSSSEVVYQSPPIVLYGPPQQGMCV